MVKIEDIQHYGKEHLETIVASAHTLQGGFQAIATAYGDYAKKSFEDGKSFVEKLAGLVYNPIVKFALVERISCYAA